MKTFIWKTAFGSKERIDWLKKNYKKPITLDQYLEHTKTLPHNHRKASKCRTPSANRKDYDYLVKTFGFFTKEARAE